MAESKQVSITAGTEDRDRQIIKTSIIGIIANVLLAAFKAVVGFITGSIAIILDAVNNISDAASSVITIIGTKYAGKEPNRKHPFGHGRAEYMSAMIIAAIVLYAGITSLTESVKKIIHPSTPSYTGISLIIVGVAVVVKIVLGQYVKRAGKKLNSDSLVNSGEDASMDAVISASTLVAALIFIYTGISLESWLGAVISVIIIKSGVEMLQETVSKLLGQGADVELVKNIKATVNSYPDVSGAYDLILNDYGPDRYNGSIHIEIPDTYNADMIDDLVRQISVDVYQKYNVALTAIGVYSVNTKDEEIIRERENVRRLALSVDYVRQIHGFYMKKDSKILRFDIVVSFDSPNKRGTFGEAVSKIQEAYPDYTIEANMDMDFAEIK